MTVMHVVKLRLQPFIRAAFIAGVVMFAITKVFGLGSDHPAGQPVGGSSAWPEGMKNLVNTPARVHGYFVNAEDVFFFSGGAAELSAFLADYSRIQPVDKHRLILHEGKGEARSPWDKVGRPCDWKLYGCPKSWLSENATDTGYVLEVHLWTGGRIDLNKVTVPKNVEVQKAK